MMDIIDRIEQFLQGLQLELEKLAPSIEGTVSPGSAELPALGYDLKVQFPVLEGTHDTHPVSISFSIVTDFSQLLAGKPVNKPTITTMDYLHPWLQIYVYQRYPFVLRITPEETDIMTKITGALGVTSRGLRTGWPAFDDHYFLDCRSGKADAEAFLRMPGIREKLEALYSLHLLCFENAYIKLVVSVEEAEDYESERVLDYICVLSELADTLGSAGE